MPAALPPAVARDRLAALFGDVEVEAKVVSPALDLSVGQWLANEEDGARAEAEQTVGETADTLAPEARVVDAEVGDVDPVQAAEDALATFPAEEIVVVLPSEGGPERDPSWVERTTVGDFERLGLPVRARPGPA